MSRFDPHRFFYLATKTLEKNISELIRNANNRNWSQCILENLTKEVENARGFLFGERWGRIGIYFKGGRPDIFVGFILDPGNLKTTAMNEAKGPDISLLLGFDGNTHTQYRKSVNYINLINNLKLKVERDWNDGWELYMHHEDDTIKNIHEGVPVHIRKPMFDVFAECTSSEEQQEKYFETATALIKLVTDEQSFWDLREEFTRPELKNTA